MKKTLTPNQALLKAANYCAYQERCHAEVEAKLNEWGVYGAVAANIIARLIEEGYLNEERFAKAFAGGKFRTKQWGRNKIVAALKAKQISAHCIRQALLEVDEEAYMQTLEALASKKLRALSGTKQAKQQKVISYLQGKGFELPLILEIIKKIQS